MYLCTYIDPDIFRKGCQILKHADHVLENDEDGNKHRIARLMKTGYDENGTAYSHELELELLDDDVCVPTQFLCSHGQNSKTDTLTYSH
jgi:hypothetical protein